MIAADQPPQFDGHFIAAVSSMGDGQMQLGWEEPQEEVVENRRRFLAAKEISLDKAVLVRVRYGDQRTYDVIETVGNAQCSRGMYQLAGEAADCLVTNEKGVALFLPVADCVATIVYDPEKQVVALAHLGRHSTVARLAEKLVTNLAEAYGSSPKNLKIWMSPSIRTPHYILQRADFMKDDPDWQLYCTPAGSGFSLDMQEYNKHKFITAGVPSDNIMVSSVDTATSKNYWSHYTATTVEVGSPPPRFAVACSLR